MNPFADLTDKQKKGVIIHHWDTDGMVSAALLQNHFKKNYPDKKLELFTPTITNYYVTDQEYQKFIDKGYDFVLTCDINFQTDTINRLAEIFPGQVYVFDHHHQDPYTNVHYYNEPHPACASYINALLGNPNNLQQVIAIVGDKEEAVQQDPELYPMVEEMMEQHNITFTELLEARRLIDSNYIIDDYNGIRETVHLLRHDPLAVLTDVRLKDNITKIANETSRISDKEPKSISDHVMYKAISTKMNILSHVTRNLSRKYPDKIIFTKHFKNDQYTCYGRRRDLNVDMRDVIAFARELGLNSGGKEDVVGIIIPKDGIDEYFSKIQDKLTQLQPSS